MYRIDRLQIPQTFKPIPSQVAEAFANGEHEYKEIITRPDYGYYSFTNKDIPEEYVILKSQVTVRIYSKHSLGTTNHYGYEQYNTHIYTELENVYTILTQDEYKKMLEDYSISDNA